MRKHYIDNLRSGIVLLVIFYHIIYNFNSIGVIRNVTIQGVPEMDVFLYIIYPWFMACMFLLAGISARYSLNVRTDRQFLKERVQKLLVPSIAGIFILGWVCGFITDQYADMFQGAGNQIPGVVRYLIYCVAGIGPLWFMHELILASLILVLLRKIDKNDKIWNLCKKVNLPIILLLVFAVWGSANILNTPLIEIYRNGIYIFMFLLGYYVFSHDEIQNLLEKYRYLFLAAAVILCVIYTVHYWGMNYSEMGNLKSLLTNVYAWFMILAVLGCGKAWFDKETGFTIYMRKRSFAFYVLHYPLMVILTYVVDSCFTVPPLLFYFILIILEILLLPPVYEIISRIPVLRRLLLGICKKRQ